MTSRRKTALDEKLFLVHRLGRWPRGGALPRRPAGWDDYYRNERRGQMLNLDGPARHLLVSAWAGSVLPLFHHYRTDDRVEKAVNLGHQGVLLGDGYGAWPSYAYAAVYDADDLVTELRATGIAAWSRLVKRAEG